MTALQDFAEWFKARETKIEAWYSDGVGRFAFRVTVDDQAFVCAARSSPPKDGKTSIMARVAGKAQTSDALIALRLPGGIRVFDPVTVLDTGERDTPAQSDRRERDESWVAVDLSVACTFSEWYDGDAKPLRFADVTEA